MKHLFTTTLFFICALSANSQISITGSNMPASGDTVRFSNAQSTSVGNYTVTGANYNWNFSTLIPTGQAIRKFQASTSTPYFFYFLPPQFGEKTLDSLPLPSLPLGFPSISIKNIYSFYRKTPIIGTTTSFDAEGLGLSLSSIPVGATFTDNDELYNFPLNYLDKDSTTFNLTTPTSSLIPFTYKKRGYRITKADGWGTITTPYGTANCLRVITTQFSIDTIKINALPAPFNKFGFPNYERKYQWLTLGEKIPYFEIIGTLVGTNFTPTQYRYRDVVRTFVGIEEQNQQIALSVFPNPSANQFTLIIPQNNQAVTGTLTDLQGKIVLTQQFLKNNDIVNQHQLNVSDLPKGIYILTLTTSLQKQNLKIIVQ
jgi:hypothetical protein